MSRASDLDAALDAYGSGAGRGQRETGPPRRATSTPHDDVDAALDSHGPAARPPTGRTRVAAGPRRDDIDAALDLHASPSSSEGRVAPPSPGRPPRAPTPDGFLPRAGRALAGAFPETTRRLVEGGRQIMEAGRGFEADPMGNPRAPAPDAADRSSMRDRGKNLAKGAGNLLGVPTAPIADVTRHAVAPVERRAMAAALSDDTLNARRAELLKIPAAAREISNAGELDFIERALKIPEAQRTREAAERATGGFSTFAETTAPMLPWTRALRGLRDWFSGMGLASEPAAVAAAPKVSSRATEAAGRILGEAPTLPKKGGPLPNRLRVERVEPAARPAGTQEVLSEAERILSGGGGQRAGNRATLEAAQELGTGKPPLDLGEVGRRRALTRGETPGSPPPPSKPAFRVPLEVESAPPTQSGSQYVARLAKNLSDAADKRAAEEVAQDLRGVGREPKKGLRGLVAPHTLSPEATEAARQIRRTMAVRALSAERRSGLFADVERAFDQARPAGRLEFMRRFERGEAQTTPALEAVAQGFRDALETKYREVQAISPTASEAYVEHYLPHFWEQPDRARQVFSRMAGSAEGCMGFLKGRQIPTIDVGLRAGLALKDDNPARFVIQRLNDYDTMLSGHALLGRLEQDRLLVRLPTVSSQVPEGYELLPGSMTTGGAAAVPHDVAQVFKNWMGPGIRGTHLGPAFEAVRKVGATANMLQLGASAFHGMTTALNSVFSDAALGLRQLATPGTRLEGLARTAFPYAAPVRDFITGRELLSAARSGTGNPRIAAALERLELAGGRTAMQQIDVLSKTGNALDLAARAIRRGEYGEAAKQGLPAAIESLSAPIMRQWVPAIKQGAFSRLAEFEMRKLGPGAGEQDVLRVLQRAWDSIDNRFGQVVYDNTFWNKTLRDTSLLSIRAVGWTYGTLREIGGAAVDAAKLRGLTNRVAYTAGMFGHTALLGALTTYLMTGEGPKELKDYYYPRVGGVDEHGNPNRIQLPTYIRDTVSWATHPLRTAQAKLHPLAAVATDVWSNTTLVKDQAGRWRQPAIIDPQDPYGKIVKDVGEYIARQLTPFSFRLPGWGPFFGITPAPAELTRSQEQQEAMAARSPQARAIKQKHRMELDQ